MSISKVIGQIDLVLVGEIFVFSHGIRKEVILDNGYRAMGVQ